MKIRRKTVFLVLVVAVCSSIITSTFNRISYSLKYGESVSKIATVKQIIDDYGMYDVDEKKLGDYGSMGIAAAVEDPYTVYFTNEDFSSYTTNIQTTYVGVGATVGTDKETNSLVIVSPMDGSPAEKAGVRAGDILKAVDGEEYDASQLTEASYRLRSGDIGSTVNVTLEREGIGIIDLTITRDEIIKETVSSELLENDIGYIRISEFDSKANYNNKSTFDEFSEHYNALLASGMNKMIIDLRNNPGGDLDVVCDIADLLLPKGIITYTEDKYGNRDTYNSDKNECNLPVCVLVNGGSASASEVLTGALKDYDKATVIGTKTFGKGIVQSVIPFTDGSGLSVTTAKYFTPNGKCIHDIGIEPDIKIELGSDVVISELDYEDDLQLQKAVEILQ